MLRKGIYIVGLSGVLLFVIWGIFSRKNPENFSETSTLKERSQEVGVYEWEQKLTPFPELKLHESEVEESIAEIRPESFTGSRVVIRSFEPIERADSPLQTQDFISPVRVLKPEENWFQWKGPVAPVGRMLRVELLNAIDSSVRNNPVLGLVTHDFYWNGRLLIPAGTEVHGRATTELARESLMTGDHWQLVFIGNRAGIPNGWVLPVVAMALERQDKTGEGRSFGMTDMRLGLPGVRMEAEEYLQIKLFLSNFLGAAVSSLQTRKVHSFSGTSVVEESARNATLAGLADVLREYSQGVLKEIERVGFYVRIRAGTQFYLMVQEPLDINRGKMGGERILEFASGMASSPRRALNLNGVQELEEQLGFVWEDLWRKAIEK